MYSKKILILKIMSFLHKLWIVRKIDFCLFLILGCKMSRRVLDWFHQIHSCGLWLQNRSVQTSKEFIICPVSSQHCETLDSSLVLHMNWSIFIGSVWIFSHCGVKNQISHVWTTADDCKVPLIFSFYVEKLARTLYISKIGLISIAM